LIEAGTGRITMGKDAPVIFILGVPRDDIARPMADDFLETGEEPVKFLFPKPSWCGLKGWE